MPIPRFMLGTDVFNEALDRFVHMYEGGHRVVVSFSGGKDSGIITELAVLAAKITDRLPVDVVMRDDEIMFPGTFEYAERIAERPEISFKWVVARQPVINMFNRKQPYFWCFDPLLKPEQWVRTYPDWAIIIPHYHIEAIISRELYPTPDGKDLIAVIGLRTQESQRRRYGLYSSQSFLTKEDRYGVRKARPIYDWMDGDVWKAYSDNKWDYNNAYDVMNRMGVSRQNLRIAPPTQTSAAIDALWVAFRAWPKWADKVSERLPGIRTAAMFGKRSVTPYRKHLESWEDCYQRECMGERAPEWIRARATKVAKHYLRLHARHSSKPFPDVVGCSKCGDQFGSWKRLALMMYMGDPFSLKQSIVPYVEPEFFRPGSGTWDGGRPTW